MSEENKNDDKKLYELGFHIVSSIPEEKVSDEVENLKASLNKIDAEIVKEGETKPIDLAYEITKKINEVNTKFNTAYFGWIKFNATAEGVESLKAEIDNNLNVLRYLLVKTVDDDEHSTAKIALEEEKDAEEGKEEGKSDSKESDADEKSEKSEAKVDSEEDADDDAKKAEEDAKNSGEKSVDDAIDEIVG
jgi:ribosomal protein S6